MKSRKISFDGKSKSLYAWARDININVQTLRSRIKHGWTIEDALTLRPLTPTESHKMRPPRVKLYKV